MEKVFWLLLYGWRADGTSHNVGDRSGPFTSHAEAERTLREAIGTGKFASGVIITERAPFEDENE